MVGGARTEDHRWQSHSPAQAQLGCPPSLFPTCRLASPGLPAGSQGSFVAFKGLALPRPHLQGPRWLPVELWPPPPPFLHPMAQVLGLLSRHLSPSLEMISVAHKVLRDLGFL